MNDKQMYIKLGSNLRKLIYFANEHPDLWQKVKEENPNLINKLKERLEMNLLPITENRVDMIYQKSYMKNIIVKRKVIFDV